MTSTPKIGEIALYQGIPYRITAIAEKWDIQDVLVIWGKMDNTTQMVAEYHIPTQNLSNEVNARDEVEAYETFASRAFGI